MGAVIVVFSVWCACFILMFVGYLQEKQEAMCPHVSVVSDADNDAGYCDADNDDVLL